MAAGIHQFLSIQFHMTHSALYILCGEILCQHVMLFSQMQMNLFHNDDNDNEIYSI